MRSMPAFELGADVCPGAVAGVTGLPSSSPFCLPSANVTIPEADAPCREQDTVSAPAIAGFPILLLLSLVSMFPSIGSTRQSVSAKNDKSVSQCPEDD